MTTSLQRGYTVTGKEQCFPALPENILPCIAQQHICQLCMLLEHNSSGGGSSVLAVCYTIAAAAAAIAQHSSGAAFTED
jgi:hypothetical protein